MCSPLIVEKLTKNNQDIFDSKQLDWIRLARFHPMIVIRQFEKFLTENSRSYNKHLKEWDDCNFLNIGSNDRYPYYENDSSEKKLRAKRVNKPVRQGYTLLLPNRSFF